MLILIGCNKDNTSIELTNPVKNKLLFRQNLPAIIHASESIDIRASDVFTSNYSIQRKIEFIDRFSNLVKETFIISLNQIDTSVYLLPSIEDRKISGDLTIESDNITLFSMKMHKGVILPNKSLKNLEKNIISSRVNTCKFNLVHGCVSNEIKNMGIFEYSACLYAAPECYALLWAGCAFNYCVTGEQK